MTIEQIARATGGRIASGDPGALVTAACTDSRQAAPGSLFTAIRGEHADGHDYLPQAARRGAVAALVDHETAAGEGVAGAPAMAQIVVPDTARALGQVARASIGLRRAAAGEGGGPFTVLAVTGSVGKTTTKDLLAAILSTMGETVAPVGSFNNDIGLPLTACRVGPSTRYLVAEMGASAIGDIAYLASLVPPDVAIELKVGVAHLGGFGSVDNIRRAKAELVEALRPGGTAVLNADDPNVARMEGSVPRGRAILRFSPSGGPGDVAARDVALDGQDRASFTLSAFGGSAPVRLAVRGVHNVANALAAATAALAVGAPLATVARVLSTQGPLSPHRMAVSQVTRPAPGGGEASFTLIDDSFNANPDSMRAGIDALASWGGGEGAARPYTIAVLGAMLELGEGEEERHRAIGAYAVSRGVDAVIAVGGEGDADLTRLASCMARGAREEADRAGAAGASAPLVAQAGGIDEAESIALTLAQAHGRPVILVKGSHASRIGELADRWAGGGAAGGAAAENHGKDKGENQ